MSVDQKKKLLWGNKAAGAAAPSKTNWGATEFSSDKDKEKFLKLMGAKKPQNQASVGSSDAPEILKQDKQQQVFSDLEKMYNQSLQFQLGQRGGGRTGLS